jgi:hypothetical protein
MTNSCGRQAANSARKLKAMQQAVSAESFSDRVPDSSPEQSELARDDESVEHLI